MSMQILSYRFITVHAQGCCWLTDLTPYVTYVCFTYLEQCYRKKWPAMVCNWNIKCSTHFIYFSSAYGYVYVFEFVCIYPEIQSCGGSGRLCLFPAPHPALCVVRCGPDDRHTDAGRREHYGRQEGAQSTPPWALRYMTYTGSITREKKRAKKGGKAEIAQEGKKEKKDFRETGDWQKIKKE